MPMTDAEFQAAMDEIETIQVLVDDEPEEEHVTPTPIKNKGGRPKAKEGQVSKDGTREMKNGKWVYRNTSGRKRGRPKKEPQASTVVAPETLNGEGIGLRTDGEIEKKYNELFATWKDDWETRQHLIRWRATNDLFWFGNEFLGLGNYVNPENGRKRVDPEFHMKLCYELEQRESTLILIPRDHGKSTWVATMAAQDILRDPDNVRLLLISASASLAEGQLRYIVSLLTQPSVLHYFKEIVPEPGRNFSNWDTKRAQDLTIKKSPARLRAQHQIMVCPYNALITGHHFDHIICDDIVDEKSNRTGAMRQKSAERVTELNNIKEPTGRFTMIGTRYHMDDVYGRVMGTTLVKRRIIRTATEVPANVKKMMPRPEGVEVGDLEDPNSRCVYNYYDKDMLRDKRSHAFGMDGRVSNFYSQYYNQPRAPEDIMFRPPIRTYTDIPKATKEQCKRYIALDTANTQHDHSDFNGITVVYRSPRGLCYIEEAVQIKGVWEDAAMQMIRLAIKHSPIQSIAVETTLTDNWMVMYQRALEIYMQTHKAQRREFPALPRPQGVIPIRQASKNERVDMLFGASYRTETCVVQADQTDLIRQMEEFPAGKHDDLVDSTATCLGLANPVGGLVMFHKIQADIERVDPIRAYLTGRRSNRGFRYGQEFAGYAS